MPFTVSHAAAFLPFRKLNLVWSAFIIGSVAPDFPYLIGNTRHHALGHHYPGLIYFTIPASMVALWLFHNLVKQPVVGLLPRGMQLRIVDQMGAFRFGPARRFLLIMVSMLLGIATHIVWDDFTHSYTWAWYRFRWLRGVMRVPIYGHLPKYAVLQYGSTVLGLVALAIWIWLWYRRTAPRDVPLATRAQSRFRVAIAMVFIACLLGLLRAVTDTGLRFVAHHPDHFALLFSVTALALVFWQLLLYCVLVSTHQVWTLT